MKATDSRELYWNFVGQVDELIQTIKSEPTTEELDGVVNALEGLSNAMQFRGDTSDKRKCLFARELPCQVSASIRQKFQALKTLNDELNAKMADASQEVVKALQQHSVYASKSAPSSLPSSTQSSMTSRLPSSD